MANTTTDPHFTGAISETKVSKQISNIRRPGYIQIRDILIPSVNSLARTQIDHVVVSNYGVYCIETKSHNGFIRGHTNSKEWTQYLNPHTKYPLQNPLKQNINHGRALNAVIGEDLLNANIISLVVFPNAKKIIVKGKGSDSVGDLQHIKNMVLHNRQEYYNDQEVEEIITRIKKADENNKENLTKTHC